MSVVGRLNEFRLDISEDIQYKLKIFGVTALVLGTGYVIHKYYQQRNKQPDDTPLTNKDEDTPPPQVVKCPAIHVHDAVHGLAKIELMDLTGEETEFEIEINDANNIRFLQFNINNIALDMAENKTYIYCRLPLRLKDYFIGFRMRCKVDHKLDDLWTPFSSKTVLQVPSSLISRNFKQNETVTFVRKGSNQGSSGTIVKILDVDCALYVIQDTRRLTYHMVHCSRIYRKGPFLYNVLDAVSDETQKRMDQSVLLGLDEDTAPQAMDVFNCLSDVYTKYAKQMEIDKGIHHVYIGRFIAKNVMDMLYEKSNKSHVKVHCLMEYKHRFMKLDRCECDKEGIIDAVSFDRCCLCALFRLDYFPLLMGGKEIKHIFLHNILLFCSISNDKLCAAFLFLRTQRRLR
eukprot:178044_1